MRGSNYISSACLVAVAASAPAPQVPGYSNADASLAYSPSAITPLASSFGPDSQVPYTPTAPPKTGAAAAPPLRSSDFTGPTSHGPYSGAPTTTGAVSNIVLASSVGTLPPNPTATYYNPKGLMLNPQPAPYVPAGKRLAYMARLTSY